MSDSLSLVTHSNSLMAKTWNADGSITSYGDAKYLKLTTHEVSSIAEFFTLLQSIESKSKTCLIRGRYVGDETAKRNDGPDFKQGAVRKSYEYFEDQPLHLVCLDVDGFDPLTCDPIAEPVAAIDEFISTMLPPEFFGVTYVWQLSNTFGHPGKIQDGLKVHLWFWLAEPLTSAQFKSYAREVKLAADLALFQPVQPHYTAAPVGDVIEPVCGRSGIVDGIFADVVELSISEQARAAVNSSISKGERLRGIAEADPIAQRLAELGLIKSETKDGFNIECPFCEEHTSESAESSTQYRLPHTGGHAVGQFICLHAHCKDRPRSQFLQKIGIDAVEDDFAAGDTPSQRDPAAPKKKTIPEAMHLTTDQANAGRIVQKFGKRLMVVAGQWYAWTGLRWEQDDGEVYRCGCLLSKIIHVEADEWAAKKGKTDEEREANAKVADALRKWASRSEMKASIEAALGLAKKLLVVPERAINRNHWLLNCLNGTVDLRTGEVFEHNPDDYITMLVPFAYDPAVRSATWDQIVAKVTIEEGLTTKPVAKFLQRWFGYCATGSTREQAFVVHYGNGSNGKSTIIDTVATVLGDYASTSAPGLLVSNSKNDRHPTELADLFGRRMVTAHETSEGGQLREDLVKQLTGGDKIKARFMRADFFEFDPIHKLQMLTNHKPQIKGSDSGIWRRVLLVPYLARFADAEEVLAGRAHYIKDTNTAEKLKSEMQGVLTWIVEGAKEWFTDGLKAPDAVLAASRDYQNEQDRVGQFLSDCCEFGAEFWVSLSGGLDGGLYDAYRDWCNENGFYSMSKQKFTDEVKRVVPGCRVEEAKERGTRKKIRKVIGVQLL